jgi:hypothetical protein
MRKLIAVSLVSFAILGADVRTASAWCLLDALGGHGCCAHICCRQYNAFSPFCCEGAAGYCPMPGYGYGGSPGCSFSGDQGYLGELPTLGTTAEPAVNGQALPPANTQPAPNSSVPTPRENTQALRPAIPPQTFPAWGGGMTNPGNVSGPYLSYPGYGPVNGNGVPSSYPGFTGYGPANGFGR